MKARIVQIGNSRGIRIPKALLEEAGLEGEVELSVDRGRLVIESSRRARAGWEKAFAAMASAGDDRSNEFDSLPRSSWDGAQWRW